MKKLFWIFALLITGFIVCSQSMISSMDMADPRYTADEKKMILTMNGLYFNKIIYTNEMTAGSYYKGVGQIKGISNVNTK